MRMMLTAHIPHEPFNSLVRDGSAGKHIEEILAAIKGTPARVGQFLDLLCAVGRPVEISFLWRPMLRDPDDEMVLEAAAHGRAERLLTFNLRHFAGADRLGVTVERPGPAWQAWKG